MNYVKVIKLIVNVGMNVEGIIRSRRQVALIKKLRHELNVSEMKVNALLDVYNEIAEGGDPEAATERFMMNKEFIDIIEAL